MNSFSKLRKSILALLGILLVACSNEKPIYTGHPLDENGKPISYSTLNPPKDITPAMTREWFLGVFRNGNRRHWMPNNVIRV